MSSLPENMQGHQDLKQRAGNSLGGHAVEAQNLKKCEQLKAWSAKPTLGALLFHIYNLFSRPMVEKFFAYPKIVEFRNSKNIIAHSLYLQFLRAFLDPILAYSSRPCQLVCCTTVFIPPVAIESQVISFNSEVCLSGPSFLLITYVWVELRDQGTSSILNEGSDFRSYL